MKMVDFLAKLVFCFCVLSFCTVAVSAKADWYESLVQISCVPSLNYFSIKTFGLEDKTLPDSEQGEKSAGIYTIKKLSQAPVSCQLNNHVVSVESLSYHEPQSKGVCGGVESASFSVKIDGVVVDKISSAGQCMGTSKEEITLSSFGGQHCIGLFSGAVSEIEGEDFVPVEIKCKTVRIPDREDGKSVCPLC